MAVPVTSLPSATPTKSYWQTPPHRLENYCSEGFPREADTIIIGSGISGALIAHHLLSRDHGIGKKSILMLEARAVCSGATGRNGGHIKPDCYRGFNEYKAHHGPEVAKQQCMFELANVKEFSKFIQDQGLAEAVDLVVTRSADACMTEKAWKRVHDSYSAYKAAGGDVSEIEVYEGLEAQEKTLLQCQGAITFPACSLWPYKLTTSLIEKSLEQGLQLYTNTPVLQVKDGVVSTPKGDIKCSTVFHATNGYATYLLPDLAEKFIPLKGQVAAINTSGTLDHTYGVHWDEDYDYLIQRPNGGPLIFGGGDLAYEKGMLAPFGDWDDSTVDQNATNYLRDFPKYFNWQSDMACTWSGVMGCTADGLPFVGKVPGREGEYISAGYNGHGMARAFLTIKALIQYVYGEEIDPRVPKVYFELERRLKEKDSEWEEMVTTVKSIHGITN